MKKILFLTMSIAYLGAVAPAQKPTVKVEPYLRGDTETSTITKPVPEYPTEALGKGFNGVVSVQISVDKDGHVAAARATRGPANTCEGVTDPAILAFRKSATEAALRTTFQTPVSNGQQAMLDGIIRYDFESSDKGKDAGITTGPRMAMQVSGISADHATAASKVTFDGVVLDGKALSLPKPPYPPAARAVRASGAVGVQVLIDTDGNVFSAISVSGHPLLRPASETAACGAKFTPTLLEGKPVLVSGVIIYNFVP